MDALVGNTGFVGSLLWKQYAFSRGYNSRNIQEAKDYHFDSVVCAAAPGSMFEANRFPDRDEEVIENLIDNISDIHTKKFILISSIAVLEDFEAGEDEYVSSFQRALAYGRNRRRLEEFCIDNFKECVIVRLPALFGAGLKKNFLFDILNPMPSLLTREKFDELLCRLSPALQLPLKEIYEENSELGLLAINRNSLERSGLRERYDEEVDALSLSAIQFTNPASRFQYYDMTRLWDDIQIAVRAQLPVIHLAPEPLAAKDVYKVVTGRSMPSTDARIHKEDMRTRHAELWGKEGSYIANAADTLSRLRVFVANERAI